MGEDLCRMMMMNKPIEHTCIKGLHVLASCDVYISILFKNICSIQINLTLKSRRVVADVASDPDPEHPMKVNDLLCNQVISCMNL